jgi:hypothetical protein
MDEREFLSKYGIRSLSKHHQANPYVIHVDGHEHRVDYTPGESTSALFGGNSNWRGPIWFPLNFLIVEALERYHRYYEDSITIPLTLENGSVSRMLTLDQAADEIRHVSRVSFFRTPTAVVPATVRIPALPRTHTGAA